MAFPWGKHRRSNIPTYSYRQHLPWAISPVQEHGHPAQHDQHNGQDAIVPSTSTEHGVPMQHTETHANDAHVPHFKHRHESSTIELFYDLFFVANLATFTINHGATDSDTLANYVGFFTILWFTWFQTSLYDVRFGVDSVMNRIFKTISFGVMTGFAITGANYDTINATKYTRSFKALSLILMVSRLTLAFQYGTVLWYTRRYKKTYVPLLATIATLVITAMIFLGTFFSHDNVAPTAKTSKTHIAYYIVVCFEALAVVVIACIWRVISFKHTHLVERLGLLTLIIIGEGILGMSKSLSKVAQNNAHANSREIGVIISAVLLIYFIYILYFDQIEHDRFGTIRQQFWAILHFPLHVAILLTVEGSTDIILWNVIVTLDVYWYEAWPWPPPVSPNYHDATTWVAFLRQIYNKVASEVKPGYLQLFYDPEPVFQKMINAPGAFNSTTWIQNVGPLTDELSFGVENAILQAFGTTAKTPANATEEEKRRIFMRVFGIAFYYFFIAAGLYLIVLAIMYLLGKTRKTRAEWASIGLRVFAGIGLLFGFLARETATNSPVNASYRFIFYTGWTTAVVMMGYGLVIVLDNVLVWYGNKKTGGHNQGSNGVNDEMYEGTSVEKQQTGV